MHAMKMLLAGAVLAISAAGANAATYYANKVIEAVDGTCGTPGSLELCNPARKDPNNALHAADGAFYSLGLGGSLTVGFAKPLFQPVDEVTVYEITYDREYGHHQEAVDVYGVLNGVETFFGRLLNTTTSSSVFATSAFEYIKLVDATKDQFPFGGGVKGDGFDVDSVKVAAIPLPATGLLLLGGLGGLAALRRRKKAD
ncbi:VPLPA-CTERM sorting domain-containing protein [Paracoccus caeni]|uniref:VPLPA-CTERM sorting domain-containing protein n=1 Tax=Paracoccus caeni TaxID=657651 RepID=A0A934SIA0_9RHOB|nr:VPLPA-CTERM sorting domain-containing protein [Paracoccus caeni]MBK4218153.1 VPLPA-CTERM sorting domain-containing protein [Paracoccus caeni]